jgi:hypothetical protein
MDQSERIVDTAPPGPEVTAAANGAHVEQPREASNSSAASPDGSANRVDRAEQMVDKLAERVAGFTSRWGRRVLWLGTRIKEEAEDLWAEAQSIRRGDQK